MENRKPKLIATDHDSHNQKREQHGESSQTSFDASRVSLQSSGDSKTNNSGLSSAMRMVSKISRMVLSRLGTNDSSSHQSDLHQQPDLEQNPYKTEQFRQEHEEFLQDLKEKLEFNQRTGFNDGRAKREEHLRNSTQTFEDHQLIQQEDLFCGFLPKHVQSHAQRIWKVAQDHHQKYRESLNAYEDEKEKLLHRRQTDNHAQNLKELQPYVDHLNQTSNQFGQCLTEHAQLINELVTSIHDRLNKLLPSAGFSKISLEEIASGKLKNLFYQNLPEIFAKRPIPKNSDQSAYAPLQEGSPSFRGNANGAREESLAEQTNSGDGSPLPESPGRMKIRWYYSLMNLRHL